MNWDEHAADDDHATRQEIESVLPVATLRGVRVVFSVTPLQARSITGTPAASDAVRRVPRSTSPGPFRPSRTASSATSRTSRGSGSRSSTRPATAPPAAAYQALLARSYDALKSVDPTINVIGVGLSPRGSDNPRASSNISTSPVKFLQGMGAAYRASGRTKPLMDEFAYHPYPKKDTDSLTEGYIWPNAGVTNLDRIKQAFWDAFNGTAPEDVRAGPPSEARRGRLAGRGRPQRSPPYFGAESIVPTTEAAQAAIYPALLRYVACDPAVEAVLFFGFQDEPNLDRWQAGLMRADGSARPSYDSVKAEIAANRRELRRHACACVAPLDDGRRRQGHVPEEPPVFLARCASGASSPRADEDALFNAGIYRVTRGRTRLKAKALTESGRLDGIQDALRALPVEAPPPREVRLLDPHPSRSKREARDPHDEPQVRRLRPPPQVAQPCPVPGPVPGARHDGHVAKAGDQNSHVQVPGTGTGPGLSHERVGAPHNQSPTSGGSRRRRLAATTLEAVRALPVRPS